MINLYSSSSTSSSRSLLLALGAACLATLPSAVLASAPPLLTCTNENDDSFFNACRKERESGPLTVFSNFTAQWVNPRAQALVILGLLLYVYISKSLGRVALIEIIHYMHKLSYSLILGVGLYAVFRQSRPCRCNGQHIGSIYGMPSGDAMAGAILATFIVQRNLFRYRPASVLIAAIQLMLVCIERTALGYHTIGQVTVGSCMGIALTLISERLPLWSIFLDGFCQMLLATISLQVDPSLKYGLDDMNNLWAWFMWGVAFEVLVFVCLWGERDFFDWKQSLLGIIAASSASSSANGELDAQGESMTLVGQRQAMKETSQLVVARDWNKTYTNLSVGMALFIAFSFLSSLVTRYGWMSNAH